MPEVGEVEVALREMEARLDAARVAGDADAFDRVLAADFRNIGPSGDVSGRDQLIADARSGKFTVRSSHSGDLVIRSFGDLAILSGRARLTAAYAGRDVSGTFAYTHIYVLRDGRWQVVSAQSTREVPRWLFFVAGVIARLLGK